MIVNNQHNHHFQKGTKNYPGQVGGRGISESRHRPSRLVRQRELNGLVYPPGSRCQGRLKRLGPVGRQDEQDFGVGFEAGPTGNFIEGEATPGVPVWTATLASDADARSSDAIVAVS